jgi:hypothetical protein
MTYGFLATNNSNQVLISSETRNLHLVEKIASPTFIDYTNGNYGGINILRYRTTCNVTPVPFFTMPSTSDFYGCTRVTSVSSNQWDIEIIKSGAASSYPEVYIFADPRGTTPAPAFGMKVFRDDGTPSFDSRLSPLAITGGLGLTHPSNPKPSFPYGLSSDYCSSSDGTAGVMFQPDQYNSYSVSLPSKPMFFYPSLAQAEREATYSRTDEDCIGGEVKGNCVGYVERYAWTSEYWAFYRGAIRRASSQVQAGWCVASFGCNWTYAEESGFFGVGTGGSSGQGGIWPYNNETINLSSATLIIGDASRYD